MLKRSISLLLGVILILSLAVPVFASSTSRQYPLRPTNYGDWGEVQVDLPYTDSSLYVTVKQSGIHSGEKAHTWWEIYHPSTYDIEQSRDLYGDTYVTMIFRGLKHPGGIYDVSWESKTNNDTQGWYQIYTSSSGAAFYWMK